MSRARRSKICAFARRISGTLLLTGSLFAAGTAPQDTARAQEPGPASPERQAQAEQPPATDRTFYPAPASETGRLVIRAAADQASMAPLIQDFQRLNPGISVDYVQYVTNDLFAAATKACRSGAPFADIMLSSAVDHFVKLANDGCAAPYSSTFTASLPGWANWRNEVFGFAGEVAVIAYNSKLLPAEDAPESHAQLAELLRTKADIFRDRIGTYDIRISGIGYLFAFSDLQQTSTTYGRLLESMGRLGAVVRCCSADVLDEIASGRLLLGYNILSSYALARQHQGEPIRVVIPRDYALFLPRGVMLPAKGRTPGLGERFLDYLLSPRGQDVGRSESFFFEIGSPLAGDQVEAPLAGASFLRPISIGLPLLLTQDKARRERFISDWRRSMIDMNVRP